jgi:MFS family permease
MTLQAQEAGVIPQRGLAGAWLVAIVGSCIGLAIMGDSLMYSILPLAAPGLGIPLPLVGVLLSANRLVRLLSNVGASRVFERFGPRLPFIGSITLGVIATLLYGITAGFALFLAARLLWGVAWSGMRQGGYQAVWTGEPRQKGRLTGLLWGLVRLGSAIGVLVGGVLYDRSGYHAAILFVMVSALLALPLALFFRWSVVHVQPKPQAKPQAKFQSKPQQKPEAKVETTAADGGWRSAWERPVQRWLVVAGFFQYLLSGVVVSTTAVFLAERMGNDSGIAWLGIGIATLTGMLHGVRWCTDLALGPAVGAFSDRIGQAATAALVVVVYVLGLLGALFLPPILAILCLFVVLLSDGAMNIVTSAAASGIAIASARPHAFVGVFTTTTDAGSALGPLMAYSLVTAIGLSWVYGVLGVLLLVTVLQYWRLARADHFVATVAG